MAVDLLIQLDGAAACPLLSCSIATRALRRWTTSSGWLHGTPYFRIVARCHVGSTTQRRSPLVACLIFLRPSEPHCHSPLPASHPDAINAVRRSGRSPAVHQKAAAGALRVLAPPWTMVYGRSCGRSMLPILASLILSAMAGAPPPTGSVGAPQPAPTDGDPETRYAARGGGERSRATTRAREQTLRAMVGGEPPWAKQSMLHPKTGKSWEGYYNNPTYTKSRATVVDEINKNLVVPIIGESNLVAYKAGFNDSQSDQAARISFKNGCARGVTGTPYFFVNGIPINDSGSPLDYNYWVSILDPLVGKM